MRSEKNMQYNPYLWPNCQNLSVVKEIAVKHHDGDVRLQRAFIPVFRNVKVIKIHQDFPKLRLQLYCHISYGSQCILMYAIMIE